MKDRPPPDASEYTKWLKQKANLELTISDSKLGIPAYERHSIVSQIPYSLSLTRSVLSLFKNNVSSAAAAAAALAAIIYVITSLPTSVVSPALSSYIPTAIATDSLGNVYWVDASVHSIFVYAIAANSSLFGVNAAAGNIYRIAGNGTQAGSPASSGTPANGNAMYITNAAIAFDSSDNLYFIESQRVRVIAKAAGSTFFGNSTPSVINCIYTVAGGGSNPPVNGGPAYNDPSITPSLIAFDSSGNLFFYHNNATIFVVPKVSSSTIFGVSATTVNLLYTIASVASVNALAFDSNGNLIFSDGGNKVIKAIPKVSGASVFGQAGSGFTPIIIAGTSGSAGSSGDNGLATSAKISAAVNGIAFDSYGNMFLSDTTNHSVRIVAATDTRLGVNSGASDKSAVNANYIYRAVGTGTSGNTGDGASALLATLSGPKGISIFGINLYIADTGNSVVRSVSLPTS
jgi:hypothetical protein